MNITDATERLNKGLRTLASWAQRRAKGDHDYMTTLTMLEQKTKELRAAVMPIAKLSISTDYWFTCTRCNYKNDCGFYGEHPKIVKCQACDLDHTAV